jgi:oxygen-independent coproporphyrinogen-3 oxidase
LENHEDPGGKGLAVSLYLHIPFCTGKCGYCDFYSMPLASLDPGERDLLTGNYTEVLLNETKRRFDGLCGQIRGSLAVPTVYIGGGTPSILGAAGISRFLKGLGDILGSLEGEGGPAERREISVEANPETADPSFLRACADYGVTRLSLGIQSFNGPSRRAAGRQGETELLPRVLAEVAEIFGAGLSLDLISGLPEQDEPVLLRDIEKSLSFGPGHISLYALTVEEGTPLASQIRGRSGKKPALPPADEADRLWIAGRDALIRAGYEQYEVSSFARTAGTGTCRCLHNIRYWRMENWIGTGPGASGTIISGKGRGRRFVYASDVEAFMTAEKIPVQTKELDRNDVMRETLLMGFRYTGGPGGALFQKRFGQSLEETIPRTLEKWNTLLRPGETALTGEGLLFLNPFLLDAFAELDNSKTCP